MSDIVERLMAFEAVHANEDAEMAFEAAKEIKSLRTQLSDATRKLEEITTLSCRWKASLISGDDLADKVFDVFSGRTGEGGK